MGFMGGLGRLMGSASAGAVAVSGAATLASGETQALALDFTDDFYAATTGFYGSARIIDTGTPANNYNTSPTTTAASLLTMTSPSLKWTIGPLGTGRFQAHNLCVQSETFGTTWTNNATTVSANATTAPDGNATADLISETATTAVHRMTQNVTLYAGWLASFSVRFKKSTTARDYAYIGLSDNSAHTYVQHFNLATGALGTGSATVGTPSLVSRAITDLGAGWYLCQLEVQMPAASTATCAIQFGTTANGSTTSYAGDTAYGIYVWGAHLRRTPSDSTYLATTTAARYALPLEWSTAGVLQGLLVEEARTNLVTYSDDLTNAAWTKTSLTTAKTATGPDGVANSATTCTASAANGTAVVNITSASAARSGSVYLKRRTGSGAVSIAIGETTGSTLLTNGDFATNDLTGWTNSTIGTGSASGATGAARLQGTDTANRALLDQSFATVVGTLYKVDVTVTTVTSGNAQAQLSSSAFGSEEYGSLGLLAATTYSLVFRATSTTTYLRLRTAAGGGDVTVDNITALAVSETTCAVDTTWTRFKIENKTITNPCLAIKLATSGDAVDVALGQVESGAFVTSPIPTIGATATRAVDNISLATSAFPYSATAGTVYIEANVTPLAVQRYLWELNNGTNDERFSTQIGTDNKPRILVFDGTVGQVDDIYTTGISAATTFKHAMAWESNDFAHVLNGAAAETDAAGTLPTPTTLWIGCRTTGSLPSNGYVRKLMYRPRRTANADLVTLTT